jgi:ribonuclease Z
MHPITLTLAGQTVHALSIGGIETCFQVPAFDCCLDIGRCPPGATRFRTLLLTHGHIDHASGLPYFVSMRAMHKQPMPRVYCPKGARGPLARILEAWQALQTDTDHVELVGVGPGETLPLKNGFARTFASPHRIATIGYALHRRVSKLRDALHGLPSAEIAARARAGETVHDVVERNELCFPGDTRIDVVVREPMVRTARVLLLECTFAGPDVSSAHARDGGHVHLDDIVAHADLFENEVLVLTHFSRRHEPDELERRVRAALPEHLSRRTVLLLHPR